MNSETKTHSTSSSPRGSRLSRAVQACQNCKQQFTIEPEDFAFYEKMRVPPPTRCPECRMQRRFSFTNIRSLYKRACDMCSKGIITIYSPDKPIQVYCNSCWWSDKWSGEEYAQEYDPSRPFLTQLQELQRKTPHMARDVNEPTLVNSDYVNYAATSKNCYLMYFADECENVLYSEILLHNKDSMDGTMFGGSELCYWLINAGPCYRTFFSEDCASCREVWFSKDVIGCSDCFGCTGLRNKQYYIWNEPHTKEKYFKKFKELRLDSYRAIESLKKQTIAFWNRYPRKFAHTWRNVNVTGDYIYSSKNARDMYIVHEGAEDCRYCQMLTMLGIKDAYDYSMWGNNAQRIYESVVTGEGADTVKFSFQAWPNVYDIEYCVYTMSSSHMFGCANIRNQQYCILNKRYSKEEYEKLKTRIIQDMTRNPYIDTKGKVYPYGEFLPPDLSLFSYNETLAQEVFPLTKEAALRQGFSWHEHQPIQQQRTIQSEDVPDSIHDVPDSILQEIIECGSCKKPFRIIAAELSLLKSFGLPIPRACPNCRYKERWARINLPRLYYRQCLCGGLQSENGAYKNVAMHAHKDQPCPNTFETSYSPDRSEIVYCETCYQGEIV